MEEINRKFLQLIKDPRYVSWTGREKAELKHMFSILHSLLLMRISKNYVFFRYPEYVAIIYEAHDYCKTIADPVMRIKTIIRKLERL